MIHNIIYTTPIIAGTYFFILYTLGSWKTSKHVLHYDNGKTKLLTKYVQGVINIFLLVRFYFLFENENNNQFIFITYTLRFFPS